MPRFKIYTTLKEFEALKEPAQKSGMDIKFEAVSAENVNAPDNTYDVITACQCFWYFDHKIVMPELKRMLKPDGRLLLLYMAWLPFEDEITGKSEEIILKHNPDWSSSGETRKPMYVPDEYNEFFDITYREEFDVRIPFTRESWHGRMRACRGVAAAMSEETLALWDKEHRKMLEGYPESFEILHYIAMAELTLK